MDAGAGAKTPHARARSCTLVHARLAQPGVLLVFFPALFFRGSGAGEQDRCSRGGYQHRQLLGNSTWTPRSWRIQLGPALPRALSGLGLGRERACFSSAEIRRRAGKERTRLFIFRPCSCVVLRIVLRYLLLGGCLLAVCTSVNAGSLCFVWPLEKRGSLHFINERAKMC